MLPGRDFWPDDITFLNSGRLDSRCLLDSAQVTDWIAGDSSHPLNNIF
jgi:hypothetical protein